MTRSKRHSRHGFVVILLLLAGLALLALDFQGRLSSRVRSVAQHVLAPSQSWLKGATLSLLGRRGATGEATDLDHVSVEQLKAMLVSAEAANVQQAARIATLEEENRQLAGLGKSFAGMAVRFVPATVLSSDYLLASGSLTVKGGAKDGLARGQWVVHRYLAEGESSGVATGQGVIAPKGLVGLVDKTGPYVSQVKLVTSSDCRLAARVMHWDATGRRWSAMPDTGLTQGTGDGRTLRLTQIPATTDVRPGDYVVTASAETGLAEYLVIGRVVEVSRRPTDLTHTIVLVPQVNLDRLDRVFVMAAGKAASR